MTTGYRKDITADGALVMRLLIVGGGGREHAITWRLSNNPSVEKIFAIPGNGGIAELADCRVDVAVEPEALADFAAKERIDLTVVGPETPLVSGTVDAFEARSLPIFGPTGAAARIEGSKSFAKQIMAKYGVPTAAARVFTDYSAALQYIEQKDEPIVIKADGLAAGKGVVVGSRTEAKSALHACLVNQKFGDAGAKVLVEDYISGEEVSLLSFCDGKTILPMVPAQDYKRAYDDDRGPNTGGMGCYSPVSLITDDIYREIIDKIVQPTVRGMAAEGIEFRGILYAGVIMTAAGPMALEFNARFGDPETQTILPRLKNDLLEVMLAVAERNLDEYQLKWSEEKCVSVVLASEGYPDSPITGREISGLEAASAQDGVYIFHAATKRQGDKLVTDGGRVFNVSALGDTFSDARRRAYEACRTINFEGKHFRSDIGGRAAEREEAEKKVGVGPVPRKGRQRDKA